MSITYHERPGVYVEYDTTSRSVSPGSRTAGIAARGSGSGLYRFSSAQTAKQTFPESTTMGKMLQLAFLNGAAQVLCCPVSAATTAAYTTALTTLLEAGATALAVDTASSSILSAIGALLVQEEARAALCFAGLGNPTVSELSSAAQSINCERLVLLGPDVRYAGASGYGGGCLAAAALAGLLSAQTDPALPLNGVALLGLEGVSLKLTEGEIDTLVQAGVSPLEAVGGQPCLIRAVTTRSSTQGVADNTWQELTTLCIFDDVIPAVRDSLKAKFLRRKNTAITRNAIRAQVAIILDDRLHRQIIESYENLLVEAVEGEPTACRVSFGFQVVQGLQRIHLRIHMIV